MYVIPAIKHIKCLTLSQSQYSSAVIRVFRLIMSLRAAVVFFNLTVFQDSHLPSSLFTGPLPSPRTQTFIIRLFMKYLVEETRFFEDMVLSRSLQQVIKQFTMKCSAVSDYSSLGHRESIKCMTWLLSLEIPKACKKMRSPVVRENPFRILLGPNSWIVFD